MKHWVWQQNNWTDFDWDDELVRRELKLARTAQYVVQTNGRLLSKELSLEAAAKVLEADGMATAEIEGEKLDVYALRSSVARHLGLDSTGMPTPPEAVEGLISVLSDATERHAVPLSLERLCDWHRALFPDGRSNFMEIEVGRLRSKAMQITSGPHGHEKVHYEAPPPEAVPALMVEFLEWFNNPPPDLDALVRAGIAHVWFEVIHPFDDGNGRIGRAIADMSIAQDEKQGLRLFSLSHQINRRRGEYYDALQLVSKGKSEITPWLCWFLAQIHDASLLAQQIIETTLHKAQFWLTFSMLSMNSRQIKVINWLLDRGGDCEGGMSTKKYAGLAKTSPATAQRDLAQLLEWQCIEARGEGRGTRYCICFAK